MGAGYALFGAGGGEMPKIAYGTVSQDNGTVNLTPYGFKKTPVVFLTANGGGTYYPNFPSCCFSNLTKDGFTYWASTSFSTMCWIAIGE